ncbi:unnamed protein product [Amoebophrya sp. A120]|nr:unnamed protein product [Amoebophrya sp. A120]|eukprot:GSA120T00008272001.1
MHQMEISPRDEIVEAQHDEPSEVDVETESTPEEAEHEDELHGLMSQGNVENHDDESEREDEDNEDPNNTDHDHDEQVVEPEPWRWFPLVSKNGSGGDLDVLPQAVQERIASHFFEEEVDEDALAEILPLPAPWEERKDETFPGKPLFVNPVTGEATLARPRRPPLGPDYRAVKSLGGRVAYHNVVHDLYQWEHPGEMEEIEYLNDDDLAELVLPEPWVRVGTPPADPELYHNSVTGELTSTRPRLPPLMGSPTWRAYRTTNPVGPIWYWNMETGHCQAEHPGGRVEAERAEQDHVVAPPQHDVDLQGQASEEDVVHDVAARDHREGGINLPAVLEGPAPVAEGE